MRYRLYFFNVAGHIIDAMDLSAVDDAEAVSQVLSRGKSDRREKELWQGDRRVQAFPQSSEAA